MILSLGSIQAQTIRNSNNSVLATISSNGDVRNSNNSLVARINRRTLQDIWLPKVALHVYVAVGFEGDAFGL